MNCQLTVVEALVLGVFDGSSTSDAVTVAVPGVLRVTWSVTVPPESEASAGRVAAPSLLVRWIASLADVAKFQLASTAFTVTENGAPANWGSGVPVLPVAVPGAAVSPGINICSFVKRRVNKRK